MQVYKYATFGTNFFSLASMQVSKYNVIQVSMYASIQVCQYASMQVYNYGSIQPKICFEKRENLKESLSVDLLSSTCWDFFNRAPWEFSRYVSVF